MPRKKSVVTARARARTMGRRRAGSPAGRGMADDVGSMLERPSGGEILCQKRKTAPGEAGRRLKTPGRRRGKRRRASGKLDEWPSRKDGGEGSQKSRRPGR